MAAPDVERGLTPLSGLTFDVTVEIPKGQKNKYEVDHETGRIRLDRTLFTSTQYPADYGFIEGTLGQDGDPSGCAGVDHRADLSRLPDQVPGSRDVPDEGRGGWRRQGALRPGVRSSGGITYAISRTCASGCSWRSSTSSRSTRTLSLGSRLRAPPGPASRKPRTRFAQASSEPRSTASTVIAASASLFVTFARQ